MTPSMLTSKTDSISLFQKLFDAWDHPDGKIHFQAFANKGFPSRKNPLWHYTDLQAYQSIFEELHNPKPTENNIDPLLQLLASLGLDYASSAFCVVHNGYPIVYDHTCFHFEKADTLTSPTPELAALNSAFCPQRLTITPPPALTTPLVVINLLDCQNGSYAAHTQLAMNLQAKRSATLIELRLSLGEHSGFFNTHTELNLQEQAQLNHTIVQKISPKVIHTASLTTTHADQSHYQGTACLLGGKLNRLTTHHQLIGRDVLHEFKALLRGVHKDKCDLSLQVEHRQPCSTSQTLVRGIMKDSAKGSVTGNIKVHQQASETTAHFENKNLLLSPTAEMNTRPQLEIDNDQVRCTHGATVGQLDTDALFYLMTRGISLDEAVNLLVASFQEPALAVLPSTLNTFVRNLLDESA